MSSLHSVFASPGWITKIGGLLALLGGIGVSQGDLTYSPAVIGIGTFIGNWASRQANITSEQAGIKAPEVVVAVTPLPSTLPPVTIVVEKTTLPPEAPSSIPVPASRHNRLWRKP